MNFHCLFLVPFSAMRRSFGKEKCPPKIEDSSAVSFFFIPIFLILYCLTFPYTPYTQLTYHSVSLPQFPLDERSSHSPWLPNIFWTHSLPLQLGLLSTDTWLIAQCKPWASCNLNCFKFSLRLFLCTFSENLKVNWTIIIYFSLASFLCELR